MALVIYAIGGEFNERVVGAAHDSHTAKNLIRLVEMSGGSGVSLHGTVDGTVLSGDCTFQEARQSLGI